jgi:hypothetical protein
MAAKKISNYMNISKMRYEKSKEKVLFNPNKNA